MNGLRRGKSMHSQTVQERAQTITGQRRPKIELILHNFEKNADEFAIWVVQWIP